MGVMNPARLLLAPLWLAQLGTGAKSFSDNPILGSTALNARGLHTGRVRLAHALAARRRARLARLVDPADRAAFDRDGFVVRQGFLDPAAFAALRAEVTATVAPAREMIQGDTVTRRIALDPAAMPRAAALTRDPRWAGLVRYVGSFDAEPITYVQTILSHRHAAPPDPQTTLHADTFHPTVKAWLFLTDVAADEGPFTYVAGSHRPTAARLTWERARVQAADLDRLSARGSLRIRADELAGLGLPAPTAFAVPANTLVIADTYGFHARGPSVRPSVRAEIWAYGRRSPFLPWAGLDLIGALGARRAPLLWAAKDRMERWGWGGQPWADAGAKRPLDP